jgi:hypothetical protein
LLIYSQREKVAALPGSSRCNKKGRGNTPNNLSVREAQLHCTKTSTKNPSDLTGSFSGWFSGKLGIIGGTPGFVKVFVLFAKVEMQSFVIVY